MARIRITYRDETRTPDEVRLGAFSQIAAKRRYGLEAMKTEDPEPLLFGVFVELEGPAMAKDPDKFDDWLFAVDGFELTELDAPELDAEVPTSAGTSSEPSPASPPTSE